MATNLTSATIGTTGILTLTWVRSGGWTAPATLDTSKVVSLTIDPSGSHQRTVRALLDPVHTAAAISTGSNPNDTLTISLYLSGDADGNPEYTAPHTGETVQIASIDAALLTAGDTTASQTSVAVTNNSTIAKPTPLALFLTKKKEKFTGNTVDVYLVAYHRYGIGASDITGTLIDAGSNEYAATVSAQIVEPLGSLGAGCEAVEAFRLRFNVTGATVGAATVGVVVTPPLGCPTRTASRLVFLDPSSQLNVTAYVRQSHSRTISSVSASVPAGATFTGGTSGTTGVLDVPLTTGSTSMTFLWWSSGTAFSSGETLTFSNGATATVGGSSTTANGSSSPALGSSVSPYQTIPQAAKAIADYVDTLGLGLGKQAIGTIYLMGETGGVGHYSVRGHVTSTGTYVVGDTHLTITRDPATTASKADAVLCDYNGNVSFASNLVQTPLLRDIRLKLFVDGKSLFVSVTDPAVESCDFVSVPGATGGGTFPFKNATSLWLRDFSAEDYCEPIVDADDIVVWDSEFTESIGDFLGVTDTTGSVVKQILVLNTVMDNFEGSGSGEHTDILQFRSPSGGNYASNVLFLSSKITNCRYQAIFGGHSAGTVKDVGFINTLIEVTDDGDMGSPNITIGGNNGSTDHWLIWHVTAVRMSAGTGVLGGSLTIVGTGTHTNMSIRNTAFSGTNLATAHKHIIPNIVNCFTTDGYGVRCTHDGTFNTLWEGPYSDGTYPSDATSWAALADGPLDNRLLVRDIIVGYDLVGTAWESGGAIGAYELAAGEGGAGEPEPPAPFAANLGVPPLLIILGKRRTRKFVAGATNASGEEICVTLEVSPLVEIDLDVEPLVGMSMMVCPLVNMKMRVGC